MTFKILVASAALAALLAVASPAKAESRPDCVRWWTDSLAGPDLPAPASAALIHGRVLKQRFYSGWNSIDFMAYECGMDRELTRLIVLDEISHFPKWPCVCAASAPLTPTSDYQMGAVRASSS